MAASVIALYLGLIAVSLIPMLRLPDSEAATLTAIAATGGDAECLVDLARHRLDEGRAGDAVTLLLATVSLEPEVPVYSIHLAEALNRDGRTDEAREALDRAREQLRTWPDVEPWVIELLESTQLSIGDGDAD